MDDSIHVHFTFNSNNTNGIDPKTGKFKTGVMQNKKGENIQLNCIEKWY